MPEEIFIIIALAIVAGTVSNIVKYVVGYHRTKAEARVPEGSSLTQTELQQMIEAAVREATKPLLQEIRSLKADPEAGPADREALREPPADLLEGMDEYDPREDDVRAPRRRTRQQ
jgi:hypothetical protein